jgi:hypothetical protein
LRLLVVRKGTNNSTLPSNKYWLSYRKDLPSHYKNLFCWCSNETSHHSSLSAASTLFYKEPSHHHNRFFNLMCVCVYIYIYIYIYMCIYIYIYIYTHEHTHTHIIAIWTNKEIPLGYETRLTKSQNTPMNNLFYDVKS